MERRRQELLGWIEETKRNQRTLGIVLVPLAAIALGALAWSKPVGGVLLIGVAAIAICGFWVMAAHNAEHRQKLEELEAKERQARRRSGAS